MWHSVKLNGVRDDKVKLRELDSCAGNTIREKQCPIFDYKLTP